jgi:PAS domain S-box-containing protein
MEGRPPEEDLAVLIVEDMPDDAELMMLELTKEGFRPRWRRVDNEADYLAALLGLPDLILSDWSLPRFSGLKALELMAERGADIPFIIVSGGIGEEAAIEAVRGGAYDYVLKDHMRRLGSVARRALDDARERRARRKAEEEALRSHREWEDIFQAVGHPTMILDKDFRIAHANRAALRVSGVAPECLIGVKCHTVFHGSDCPPPGCPVQTMFRSGRFEPLETEVEALGRTFLVLCTPMLDDSGALVKAIHVMTDITTRKEAEEAMERTLKRLRRVMGSVIDVIVMAVETRDPYTAGHQKRVSNLARAIAGRMGLPAERTEGIRVAGVIHDLGKISIPAEILSTPRKLSDIEYSLVKAHPSTGYDILKEVDFDWPVAEMVLQHHERLDGSGYPRGLKDDEIILEARILAVADVVEAIASHRPYRPANGVEAALQEIVSRRGVLYDGPAVDACVDLFRVDGYRFEGE